MNIDRFLLVCFCYILQYDHVYSYTFASSIDNLVYVANRSTLFVISSSYLHQLHWSTNNHTQLVLHRRLQLHHSLDPIEHGINVFLYHTYRHVLIVCTCSVVDRCVLYDANDIRHAFALDSSIERNSFDCRSTCHTYLSTDAVIRSTLSNITHEHIVYSHLQFYPNNHRYEIQTHNRTSTMSFAWIDNRRHLIRQYIYGFDDDIYSYFLIRSSRLARLCQTSITMQQTYEEISLLPCDNAYPYLNITRAYFRLDRLFVVYDRSVCQYAIEDIRRVFHQSRLPCDMGNGFRLEQYSIDRTDERWKCEQV
jgi:hypothetical protein